MTIKDRDVASETILKDGDRFSRPIVMREYTFLSFRIQIAIRVRFLNV